MSEAIQYDHKKLESKWRKQWLSIELDTTPIVEAKKPYYNLMMFPYPSAEGLHVGNMYAFTGSDIYGRYKRAQGYDVFEPMGLDGYGIHSENYALKIGKHPMDHAQITQERFYDQLGKIGAMFDWKRKVETYDPDYYRWTQWIFVEMFKHGLAYRGKAEVNWCPSCKTVLADEQVIDGKCERCGNAVIKKLLEQWFFRITAYAEKLLQNLSKLDWSEKVKIAQRNWIGKKEGINITYTITSDNNEAIGEVECFTTRPDTNFGMTFVALAPEHAFVRSILERKIAVSPEKQLEIDSYIQNVAKISKEDRASAVRKKTGVFTGLYILNQLTNEKIPLYISDFVLIEFGTGALVGVPGHDRRDFEFAQAMKLPIKRVVVGSDRDMSDITKIEQVQEENGTMINSGFLDGVGIHEAIVKMMDHLEAKGWGKRVVSYHLRDWLISRQRYWGPPIPMIYCEHCAKVGKSWFTAKEANHNDRNIEKVSVGWYPVPDSDLPVLLPRIEDYKPGDDGVAPLAKHKEFYDVTCPGCGQNAVRETDVSDTFLDSSWYFLRYPSVGNNSGQGNNMLPWDQAITKKWLPVDMYTGGAEHSVLHLLYSRFITMAFCDWGYLDFDEPFTRFFAHGLIIKDGAKMSKSRGNVVNPDEYIEAYGADSLRLYLMFTGPYNQGGDFRDSAMEGMARWVRKVWRISLNTIDKQLSTSSATVEKALQKCIKKVGDDIERRHYNTAISAMMIFTNTVIEENSQLGQEDLEKFLRILAPFAPYISEELWQLSYGRDMVKNPHDSVHVQPWPMVNEKAFVEETTEVVVQVMGKVRDTLRVSADTALIQSEIEKEAKKSDKVQKFLGDNPIKKVIFVPGKLINFVL